MEKLEFKNKKSFVTWLKSTVKGTIISVTLLTGAYEVGYTTVHPQALVAIEQASDGSFLTDGKYYVEYDSQDNEEADLDYSQFAMAITFDVALANSKNNARTGALPHLMESLAPYEHCLRKDNDSRFNIGHVWVKLPANPIELQALKEVLAKDAVYYAFPDETGEIHQGNLMPGGGMRLYS